ncbi:MAG TPA: DHA2 family efflux MFS transporter permease subunit [Capsulimonadaceae bacterium]|jgi:DHA2 family multidrug resistance protein
MAIALEQPVTSLPAPLDANETHPGLIANQRYRWLILLGLVVSAILEVMDVSILNVALPQMAGALGSTTTDIAWVSTAYLLANVVVLPMTAWLAQRFGRKNYLVASVIIFTIARILCAFSGSLGWVIVWRLLQGAAGAALISTSQAVLVDIFPDEQQGLVQSLFGLGLVAAPAIAPLLGGWLVDSYSWQMLFLIHIPGALLSLYMISALFADTSTPESRASAGKLDAAGVAFLALGLGSLQYVLEEGQRNDWFSDAGILRFSILAVIGMTALIIWELHPSNKSPVVNLRVYANRGLWSAVVISFVTGIGMYGVNYAFAVLVQGILGFTSIKSGMALLPLGIGSMVSLAIVAAVTNKVNPRVLIVTGLTVSALGSWILGFNTLATDITDTALPLGLVGFGIGMSILPVSIAAFAALRPSEAGDGAAQVGLGRQLGGSFGIALLNTYISHMTDVHRAVMLEHFNRANAAFGHTVQGLAGLMVHHGHSWADSQQAALAILYGSVARTAVLKGYNSGFQVVALTFLACIILVPLLKAPKRGDAAPPMGH